MKNRNTNNTSIIKKHLTIQLSSATTITCLVVLITSILILKFQLIFRININWDEFYFLSRIHEYRHGELTSQFQTFHVHLFLWLVNIAQNEVTQIITARVIMYILGLITYFFIYLIGKHFLSISGALFSILCYLSISNIVKYGTSFRADPLCALFLAITIYSILNIHKLRGTSVLAGLSTAISLLISIKSILLFPVIGMALLYQYITNNTQNILLKIGIFSLSLGLGYSLLYWFHCNTLTSENISESSNYITQIYSKVIMIYTFFPKWNYFCKTVSKNNFIWALFFAGIAIIFYSLIRKKGERIYYLLLLSFIFPLFSLFFYRNAFHYFYVFILSPAIILCGILIDIIPKLLKKTHPIAISVLSIIIYITFLSHYFRLRHDRIKEQSTVIRVVHTLFPEPTPYIDRCSMISSFPKVGFFMSTWGVENYRADGKPIMGEILINNKPAFLLSNVISLNLLLPYEKYASSRYALFEEDFNILKDNFIHYWGIVYVAGKQFSFDSTCISRSFEIIIPGIYTLESEGNVLIDNVLYKPGDTVNLQKSKYTISPQNIPMKIRLRLGQFPNLSTPPFQYGLIFDNI